MQIRVLFQWSLAYLPVYLCTESVLRYRISDPFTEKLSASRSVNLLKLYYSGQIFIAPIFTFSCMADSGFKIWNGMVCIFCFVVVLIIIHILYQQ